jgi:hypothetical protein
VEEEAGVVGGDDVGVLGVAVVGGVLPESRGNGEVGEARPLGEREGELVADVPGDAAQDGPRWPRVRQLRGRGRRRH